MTPVAARTRATDGATRPKFTGTLPPFSSAVGKAPLVSPAIGGAYVGSLRASRSELPTMEITIDESTDGQELVRLDEDPAQGDVARPPREEATAPRVDDRRVELERRAYKRAVFPV